MAQHRFLNRYTRVLAQMGDYLWEIPVLADYSASQATNTSEITINEAEDSDGNSSRGQAAFNDSLAPAEWSFTTYLRPYTDGSSNHRLVDEVLWAALVGADSFNGSTVFPRGATSNAAITAGSANETINFSQSNKSALGTINIFLVIGSPATVGGTAAAGLKVMRLDKAVVNEMTMSFDLDALAQVTWSGFASSFEDNMDRTIIEGLDSSDQLTAGDTTRDGTTDNIVVGNIVLDTADSLNASIVTTAPDYANGEDATDAVVRAAFRTDTESCIRNRLTALTVAPDRTYPGQTGLPHANYQMALTGGSITITNNVTYLTPEELGKVNVPCAHVTGSRQISGDFTCYLRYNDDSGGDDSSYGFWEDVQGLKNIVRNNFAITFDVGGTSAPTLKIALNQAHVDIPTHSIEDVISLSTSFRGLGTTVDSTDEATITAVGA